MPSCAPASSRLFPLELLNYHRLTWWLWLLPGSLPASHFLAPRMQAFSQTYISQWIQPPSLLLLSKPFLIERQYKTMLWQIIQGYLLVLKPTMKT